MRDATSNRSLALILGVILAPLIVGTAAPREAVPKDQPSLSITDVTLIDGTGAPPRPHVTVRVEEGRIASVKLSGSRPAGAAAAPQGTTLDGTGKFLIPGLWDMHVHLTHASDLAGPALVANGVTGVRDLGGDLELVDWMRARITEGKLVGPRIFRAGPFVDGSKSDALDRLVIDTPEDGRRAVGFLKQRGVDFIKVHNGAPPDAYFALLEEARRAGVQVAGHIPLQVDPARAIEAGHGSLEHVVALFEGPVRQKMKAGKTQEQAAAEFTDEDAAALGRLMAPRGTWFDPTLIAYWTRSYQWDVRAKGDARERYVSASLKEFWKRFQPLPDRPQVRELLARGWARFLQIATILRRERVRFLVGTDLGAVHIYPGFSVHDELEWLVRAGLTPLEALTVATRNSAESLGRLRELGTVEVGKRADLVLLEADPLQDIGNTRSIAAVVADGRLFGKAEIEALLAEVAVRAPSR